MPSFMETQKRVKRFVPFGNAIRNRREYLHKTQIDVVKELDKLGIDITQSYYSRVEQGFHLPTPQIIEAMAKVLETTYAELTATLVQKVNSDNYLTIVDDRDEHGKNLVIHMKVPDGWEERMLTKKEVNLVYSLLEGMLKQ